jgi:tetratricopeptide (TPR) repeat protein
MHRYEELEKLYYRNKIKKYTYIVVLFAVLSAVFFAGKDYFSKYKNQKNVKINVDFKKITSENTAVNKIKDNNVSKVSVAKKTLKKNKNIKNHTVTAAVKKPVTDEKSSKAASLTPNLSFVVPKITQNNQNIKNSASNVQQEINTSQNETNKSVTSKKTEQIKVQVQNEPKIKMGVINVKEMINSFNQSPDYDTAIAIANYYYFKNNLDKAKLWALKANNINPSKYQSWKIFALILLKKNDKIKAKEVLNIYLNDYGSNDQIYKLLRSIDE